MTRNKLALLQVVVLTLVTSCGPVYDTNYSFSPPRSAEGRSCIFQCEQSKLQCQQIEDLEASRCRDFAQREERRCRDDIRYNENRTPKWYECSSESCSSDYERCETMHRACYQSCGGEVNVNTNCVANCDQADARR
jgi:hypothetical protein